jgi:chromosome segregation ATPase
MNDRTLKWVLTLIGITTGLGTVSTQVSAVGEIKGTVMEMLKAHDRRLEEHSHRLESQESKLSAAERQIDRIKDKVGIAGLKPAAANTAALPPCTDPEPEQATH